MALRTVIGTVAPSILCHILAAAAVRHMVRNDHTEASRSVKARQSPGTQAPCLQSEAVILHWLVLAAQDTTPRTARHGHHRTLIASSRADSSLNTWKGTVLGGAAQFMKGIHSSRAANPSRGYANNTKDVPLRMLGAA
jgi:hypothetical protein